MKTNLNKIEVEKAIAEVYLEAIKFFENCGITFPNSRKEHRYGLSIYIDDRLQKPKVISPFRYQMSGKHLAALYARLLKNEPIGGASRVQALIKTINKVIVDGYSKGQFTSYNVETGKYVLTAGEVLSAFCKITERALTYSLGGDNIDHLGDIYSKLGGQKGTLAFFADVLKATELSIPENIGEKMKLRKIPDIKCYTCKYCRTFDDGTRMCDKVCTRIESERYQKDPMRYWDTHHSDICKSLVSAVIDSRIDTCADYRCR